jgi:hypothetical protein
MMRLQMQVEMSDGDVESFLELVRDWQRGAQNITHLVMAMVGSRRSRGEIEALLARLGVKHMQIQDVPFDLADVPTAKGVH